jgi:hypothetical protein
MTEPTQGMALDKVLSMVRGLTAKAEHPETPPTEAEACRVKAEMLMHKYAVDQAMLRTTLPMAERPLPKSAEFATAGGDLNGYVEALLAMVAKHCRCVVRPYSRYDREQHCYMSMVYGYEHDLRFFEVLFTTLRLHMLGVLRPKIDPNLSDSENVYNLHIAGYDWREVADMYGYVLAWQGADKFIRKEDRGNPDAEKIPYLRIVGRYRTLYRKEAERRGESHTTIRHASTYREDAATGYYDRIRQRFYELEKGRTLGTELVLAKDDLEQWVRGQNSDRYTRCPECGKLSNSEYRCDVCKYQMQEMPPPPPPCPKCAKAASGHCRDHPRYTTRWRNTNKTAYSAGVSHANKADISGNKVGSVRREVR